MSDSNLTPEEAAKLAQILAKAGKVAADPPAEKKGQYKEDVEVTTATDVQQATPDRGAELKGKEVHMACRAQRLPAIQGQKCEGTTAKIIRSANKSMNFGGGEIAGGGRIATYRCMTCNGTWTIST